MKITLHPIYKDNALSFIGGKGASIIYASLSDATEFISHETLDRPVEKVLLSDVTIKGGRHIKALVHTRTKLIFRNATISDMRYIAGNIIDAEVGSKIESEGLTIKNNDLTGQSIINVADGSDFAIATSGNLSASTTRKSITVPANTDTKVTSAANHYGYSSGSGKASGLYKITTDDAGHVTGATAVTKSDITDLGIPGSDTNTDTKVTQTASSTNANYEVLFSATADNTTRTEAARKCSSIKANPSTGTLIATKFAKTNGTSAQFLMADGSTQTLSSITDSAVPIGTIVMWPSATAPTGWLICNGQSITGDAYADLRTVLGGATTVPNLSGRFPLGSGNSSTTGSTSHSLASSGGEEKHTLTTAEMPAHKHTILHGGSGSINYEGVAFANKSIEATLGNGNSAGYPIIGSSGSSNSHNNMPPFYTVNFIIKYA